MGNKWTWISVHLDIRDSPKLRKLFRSLQIGKTEAVGLIVMFWMFVTSSIKEDGLLVEVEPDDIESGAGWTGEPGRFFSALIDCGWVDQVDSDLYVHDWEQYNKPYYSFLRQKEQNKKYVRAHRSRKQAPEKPDLSTNVIDNTIPYHTIQSHAYCKPYSKHDSESEPEPVKTASKSVSSGPAITVQQVVDLYNQICSSLPKVTEISQSRARKTRARIKEVKSLAGFADLFAKVEESDFLTGRKQADEQSVFRASFDWLMKNDSNWLKVTEGNYGSSTKKSKNYVN